MMEKEPLLLLCSKIDDLWMCCICDELHKTEEEAHNCCSSRKEISTYGYQCECGRLYPDIESLNECIFDEI